MKKRTLTALGLATSIMLTACSASAAELPAANEETAASSIETTTEEIKAETSETTVETTLETTAAETTVETTSEPTPTPEPTATPIPETTMPDPFPDLAEPEGTYFTSEGEYEAYIVTDYSFSEDGLSGTFTYNEIVPFSQEYIESLSIGGVLDGGVVIDTLDYSPSSGSVWINSGNFISFELELQENGEYYLFDDIGCLASTSVGTSEFSISPDVVIVDNVSPYGPYGVRLNDNTQYYDSIAAFDSRLEDDGVWYRPELYIRVEDGEVTFISINPHQHQPWYET